MGFYNQSTFVLTLCKANHTLPMYHELFVLLSHADENNGLFKLYFLPDFINELLDARGSNITLKNALNKLTHHKLIEKIDNETYQITQSGRTELEEYKMYMEQQHQKGPNYYIEPTLQSLSIREKMSFQSLCISLAAALGLFRNAS